jgi:hypothetical protein
VCDTPAPCWPSRYTCTVLAVSIHLHNDYKSFLKLYMCASVFLNLFSLFVKYFIIYIFIFVYIISYTLYFRLFEIYFGRLDTPALCWPSRYTCTVFDTPACIVVISYCTCIVVIGYCTKYSFEE